ncbi:MAG TPA: nitrilase family protein [Methylobacter sp.]|jgi:predicted amidohydrolase
MAGIHSPEARSLKIACIQMEPRVGDLEQNRATSVRLIEEAARNGARLVVLPELTSSGYVFNNREELMSLAEEVPGGPAVTEWIALAHRLGIHIVSGVAEREGHSLYNSAVLVGPEGLVGKYRKLHLWNNERTYFSPGNLGVPVFDTPYGRIGVIICYDGWFPESYRLCALQGANLVCVPTNWVPMSEQPSDREAMATVLTMAAAHSNSMFIACADRVGVERGQEFLGQSVVIGCSGWPITGPASRAEEEIIYADIDLSEASAKRKLNEFNQLLTDRRGDVYGDLAGTESKRFVG